MTISQKPDGHNIRRALPNNHAKPLAINELPCWWHTKAFGQGKPKSKTDLIGTVILTELVSLNHNSGSDDKVDFELKSCFAYFWARFRINKLQMQRASFYLHASGIVTRSFRETVVQGNYISKELDLTLHIDRLTDFLQAEVC